MKAVYEIVDYTNDEMYCPLGLFGTLKEAITELTKSAKDTGFAISDYAEDYETINIIERKAGWHGNGKVVYTLYRESVYNSKSDDYDWKTIEVNGERVTPPTGDAE